MAQGWSPIVLVLGGEVVQGWCLAVWSLADLGGWGGSEVGVRFVGVCALWRDGMDVHNRVYYVWFVMMFGCLS